MAVRAYAKQAGDPFIIGEAYELMGWAGSRKLTELPYRDVQTFVLGIRPGQPLAPSSAKKRLDLYRRLGLVSWECGRGRLLAKTIVHFTAAIEGEGGHAAYLRYLGEKRANDAARQRKRYWAKRQGGRQGQEARAKTTGQNASEEQTLESLPLSQEALKTPVFGEFRPTSRVYLEKSLPSPSVSPLKNLHSELSPMKKSSNVPPPTPQAFDFDPRQIFKDPTQTPPAASAGHTAFAKRLESPSGSQNKASSGAGVVFGEGLKEKQVKTVQGGSCGTFGPQKIGSVFNALMPNSGWPGGMQADVAAIVTAPREMAPPPDFGPSSILKAVKTFGRTGEEGARQRLGETVWQAVEALAGGWAGVCLKLEDDVGDLSVDVYERVNACAKHRANTPATVPQAAAGAPPETGTPWTSGNEAWDEIEDWMDAGLDEEGMRKAAGPSKWHAMGQAVGAKDCYGAWVSMDSNRRCQKAYDAFYRYEKQPTIEKAKPAPVAPNSTPLPREEAAEMLARMMPGIRGVEAAIERIWTAGTSIEDFAAALDITKLAAQAGRVSTAQNVVPFLAGVLKNKRAERDNAQALLDCGAAGPDKVMSPALIRKVLTDEMRREGISIFITPFTRLPLTQQIVSQVMPMALTNLAAGRVKAGNLGFGAYLLAMMSRRCREMGLLRD